MALISAFIIAKNEESRIARAIKSLLPVADEIIVIDSGSIDNTVQVSRNSGARVIYNEWKGYVAQKIFGEKQCINEWIINIDADEELSQDLQDEIGYIFKGELQDRYKVYRMNMVIMHRSEAKPRWAAPNTNQIRLYNKKYASFANQGGATTHDAVLMNPEFEERGNVYVLNEPVHHYSGMSIEQLVGKANFYSSQQAKDLVESGREISRLRIGMEFFLWFFKAFFVRRYWVFGFDGFIDSMIFAFARFLRLAKAQEALRKKKSIINKPE